MSTDSRQRILEVATRLFSSQGIKNTNIRQIASEAKANSAMIFYHFGCKEKLFFEVLKNFASERLKIISEILTEPENKQDLKTKLDLFIQSMHGVFLSKVDLVKILHRELDNKNKQAIKVFEENMLPTFQALEKFLLLAQKNKLLSNQYSAKTMAFDFFALVANPIRNETSMQSIFKKELKNNDLKSFYSESRKRTLKIFLEGVLVHD